MIDKLARAASRMNEMLLSWSAVKTIIEVSAIEVEIIILFSDIPEWANKVAEYLQTRRLPDVREEAKKI